MILKIGFFKRQTQINIFIKTREATKLYVTPACTILLT